MTTHARDCDCPTLGCTLRRKGIQVPPSATPTRTPRRPWRPGPKNSWEAGLAGEHRPDGSFMPILDPTDGHKLSVKEASDGGRALENRVREVHQGHHL